VPRLLAIAPLVASLVVVARVESHRGARPICAVFQLVRDTSFTRVVGALSGDSVLAYRWPEEANVMERALHKDSGKTFARGFRVWSAEGPGAAAINRAHNRVLIVPWRTGDDCRRYAWTERAYPIRPAESTFVAALLRPRQQWIAGSPTMDLDLDSFVYSPGLARQADTSYGGRPAPAYVSASVLAEAYRLLPARGTWGCTPRRALKPLRAWVGNHPDSSAAELVSSWIRSLVEWIPAADRDRSDSCRTLERPN